MLCCKCKKREAVVGPRGGSRLCEVCRDYHKRYQEAWKQGGTLVRCVCGKDFRDYTGRKFCSKTCEEASAPVALELIRVCRDCRLPKPLTEEFFAANGGSRWRRECRQCQRDGARRSLARRMAQDPEAVRAYGRRKYANHPEVYKDRQRRRRARAYGSRTAPVDLEAIQAEYVAEHGLVCHICGWEIPDGQMHFDHIVPLHRGGADAADNIALAHGTCNTWKGARLMGELDLAKRREVMARQLSLHGFQIKIESDLTSRA